MDDIAAVAIALGFATSLRLIRMSTIVKAGYEKIAGTRLVATLYKLAKSPRTHKHCGWKHGGVSEDSGAGSHGVGAGNGPQHRPVGRHEFLLEQICAPTPQPYSVQQYTQIRDTGQSTLCPRDKPECLGICFALGFVLSYSIRWNLPQACASWLDSILLSMLRHIFLTRLGQRHGNAARSLDHGGNTELNRGNGSQRRNRPLCTITEGPRR